ncbi:serine hydrolase domain-containing protein [Sunxiuqinia sp. A32]|uniref:serine hydrolase domain-containing protein n=1 Tax=Sunxiuqinia sp. A32 TaxID=3461496 RepID=UPI004045AEED
MKKRIIISLVIIILTGAVYYLNLLMPIITGYAAKNLASGVFVAGRTQISMESEDLNFSVIKLAENTVDAEAHTVTSRFLWGESTAVYVNGYGCTLVKDFTAQDILGRDYPEVTTFPENPDTIPWPMGSLISDSVPSGINMDQLEKSLKQAMADTIPYKGTFALMVVYKGQPVAEVYRDDFSSKNRFLSWSMAKSFTNALVGLKVKSGDIDINKPVEITEWENDERRNITWNNLLHMNSGLEWNESYGNLSDVTVMLHKVGDMGAYTAEKDVAYPPDSVWSYSSGTTNLVCKLLRNTFEDDQEFYKYPREALFNKIGMKSAVFEMDASGTFVGSSYLYASMRDFARFGMLYLNNGIWEGEQILPEGWVEYTTQIAKGSKGQYGAFFWLNRSGDLPDAPEDTFLCRGHDGQFIVIIPSKDLVIVRTGYSKKGEFDLNGLVKGIVDSVSNKTT